MKVVKRNGAIVDFDYTRIKNVIEQAMINCLDSQTIDINQDTNEVLYRVLDKIEKKGTENIGVEVIQDYVENSLMESGFHTVAKHFILYRQEHKLQRNIDALSIMNSKNLKLSNSKISVSEESIREFILDNSENLNFIDVDGIVKTILSSLYEGMTENEFYLTIISAVREKIELHYNHSYLASRIVLKDLSNSVFKRFQLSSLKSVEKNYRRGFRHYIQLGISLGMLTSELEDFDLDRISEAIIPERDNKFMYLGIQTILDRYLLRDRSLERNIFELPQWFWMRVAMGLALAETKDSRTDWAIEFYDIISSFYFTPSTPTLFNSGTTHSQMSSCYLNTVEDDLSHIFKVIGQDNSQLSKWAGGIGTDFTNVRATGAKITSTNGLSQGIVPFIKIFNDVALAVNQGGKRKGAMCMYLENWHFDYEQFLELKKNTGDERRRAHDINTASWISDLFMERVESNGVWTMFSPDDVPELHDLYGKEFKEKYEEYEKNDSIRKKVVEASVLWKKMLTMLYETGHPWITFKDRANERNPQKHTGVIHSSNLCTEITLNTSKDETAVCNLGSLNISNFVKNSSCEKLKDILDLNSLNKTISIAVRMLDNVIDLNFYPTIEAENSNKKHRPVGLGLMGWQDFLLINKLNFDSEKAIEHASNLQQYISFYAIEASKNLAKEKGKYSTFEGSLWSKAVFPMDTTDQEFNALEDLSWGTLKDDVLKFGIRNSNLQAIAPTATISNIVGCFPCIEPVYKNIYMKENLSGNFLVVNKYLVDELTELGIWNSDMLNKLKSKNGSIQEIAEIPDRLKIIFKEAFEIDPVWFVRNSAARQIWIDQAISTNIFAYTVSGKVLSNIYTQAWKQGLKTTYYLRTLGASQVTKTTDNSFVETFNNVATGKVCSIDNPDCEVCQ